LRGLARRGEGAKGLPAVEKSCHERVDPLRNAGLGERRAD
jgi:hypothetical protein